MIGTLCNAPSDISMGESHDGEEKCAFPGPLIEEYPDYGLCWVLLWHITEPSFKSPHSPWWGSLVAPVALVNLVVLLHREPLAALFVPATVKTRIGMDMDSLPASFPSLLALGRLKGPAHLGYDTHRGSRLPIASRNHLHSSQDIAWFTLHTKGEGYILSFIKQTGTIIT